MSPVAEPFGTFTDIIESDASVSCWPVPKGATECLNGHPISTTQKDTRLYQRVDTTTGELLIDPRSGKPLMDAQEVPSHVAHRSVLDRTSMTSVPCGCGLPVHPLTGAESQYRHVQPDGTVLREGSWIRLAALRPENAEHWHPVPLPEWALEPRS